MDINQQKQFTQQLINEARQAVQTEQERSALSSLEYHIDLMQERIDYWASKAAVDPAYAVQCVEQVVAQQYMIEKYCEVLRFFSDTDCMERLRGEVERMHHMLLCGSLEEDYTSLLSRCFGEAKLKATGILYQELRFMLNARTHAK